MFTLQQSMWRRGASQAAAQLNAPFGIAPMADGSFLIADETGHRIRKVEGSAATSPTNGKIVFSSGRDGNSEIYSMNADGSGQTRLTNNAAEDAEPSISADGQTVVFRSQRDGNAEIYAMSIDGTGVTRITNVAATDRDPSISADGQKVVFMSNRDGNFEIYSISIDGTGATRLTNSPNSDGSPEFSPDGQRVTFMRDTALVYEVYVMNANGTGVTQLTNNSVDDFHPTFSSDGQRIAFSSRRDGNHEIYVMDADGTDPGWLTSDSGLRCRAGVLPGRPKGRVHLVPGPRCPVYTVNVDGTGSTALTTATNGNGHPGWASGSTGSEPPEDCIPPPGNDLVQAFPPADIRVQLYQSDQCMFLFDEQQDTTLTSAPRRRQLAGPRQRRPDDAAARLSGLELPRPRRQDRRQCDAGRLERLPHLRGPDRWRDHERRQPDRK